MNHKNRDAIHEALLKSAETENIFTIKSGYDQYDGDFTVIGRTDYEYAGGRIDQEIFREFLDSGFVTRVGADRYIVKSSDVSDMQKDSDLVKRFFARAKSHPIIAFLVILSVVAVGIDKTTGAFGKIYMRISSLIVDEIETPKLSRLPGETGWIFAGYFNVKDEFFIEGPYVSVTSSNIRGLRRYVEIGDNISLNVDRRVIIVNYKEEQSKNKLLSPITVGVISESDETGLVLPKDSKLVVRDVSEGKWPDNPNAALWLRVVDSPI